MTSIIPLSFETATIRIVEQDGAPWFVAKDVCDILGLKNSRQALTRLDDDEKADVTINDGSQMRKMATINESGLYSLTFTSTKSSAKRFKKWVTSEVLPSIRKTGKYKIKAEPEYKLPEPCDHDGRRASISEQNVLDIVEMFQRGYGHKEIASHMKCSVSAVIGIMSGQNRSRVTGIYRPSGYKYKNSDGDFRLPQPCKGYDGRGVVITDQNAIAIVEMLDQGYTESEVSKHMGCTLSTIKDIKSGRSRGRVTGVVRPQPYYPSYQEPVIDDYVPTFGEGQQRVEEWLAYVKVDPANACLALPRLFLDKLPPSERKNMFVIGALDRLAECITRLDQLDHEIEIIPDEETEQSSEPETADADKENSVTENAKNEPPYKPFSPSDIVPAPEGAVYLTPGQLAHRWGLGLATLSNWRSNGKGPLFMRPNNKGKGRVLYHIDEIKKVEFDKLRFSVAVSDG